MPPLPESSSAPNGWDLIEGLDADVVQASAVAPGQRILRLVAVGAESQSDGRHALGVRFGGLAPGGIYRAVAWVKEWQLTAPEPQKPGMPDVNYGIEPAFRVMMETRDFIDPNTGKPSNYGIARFDLGARSVVDSTGDIIASGVEAAADGWVKLWVDLRSRDGQIFALIGLLEGRNDRHVFKPAGQSLFFGGFEISPPRDVKSLSQVGSPPARTDIVTHVTSISELPPLPESSSAPNSWDLIEGLGADMVQASAVVPGQRILRLVAVGADSQSDGRHALGARFSGLASGGIYRATAWLKAEPSVRVMIEARDFIDPNTGKPSNYGIARFDLGARSVVDSTGDIIASGVEAAADDWVKLWVDLRSKDGEAFVTIGLLEGSNNRHVFKPAGQEVTFGGFEISPPRDVKSLSQVGSPPARTDIVTHVTSISELPPLPESSSAPNSWDLIEGLGADMVQASAVVPDQHILRLVAVGADSQSDGRHALGARFSGLASGGIYRATAWLKAEPSVRVMIEARDSIDPNTGKPSNYGIARFDLGARSVVDSTGDIIASGVEAAADDWVKLWVDLRSKDGEAFVTIGLLEGSNNRHVFKPAGQEVTFGGFEILPPRDVKSLSQVGSPPARTDIVTHVTSISELPPLPEFSSAPNSWDLIEGLGADVVQASAVVPGQRILRLVAVGADSQSDGRHALGARFSGLAPGGIYRATAWLKAEPSVRVMIEARDSIDSHTGNPSNYGIARFDLGARSVVDSTGDIIASGVEAAADDWVKLWVDLRSKDGEAFVTIGLLEGSNNRHVFKPAGQEVTFGGFEISRRQ